MYWGNTMTLEELQKENKELWESVKSYQQIEKADIHQHFVNKAEIQSLRKHLADMTADRDRWKSARDECERQYQEKVDELGRCIGENIELRESVESFRRVEKDYTRRYYRAYRRLLRVMASYASYKAYRLNGSVLSGNLKIAERKHRQTARLLEMVDSINLSDGEI